MSKIEWTDETWQVTTGCEEVSPGCGHCYARTMSKRLRAMALADIAVGKDPGKKRFYIDAVDDNGRWTKSVVTRPDALEEPLRWKKPRAVFVDSMSDLFHPSVPFEFIIASLGVMNAASMHTFQILTKRPERMAECCELLSAAGGLGKYIRSDSGREVLRSYFDAVAKTEVIGGRTYRTMDDPWMQVMNAAAISLWPLPNVWLGTSVENMDCMSRIDHLLECPAAVRFISAEPLLERTDFAFRNRVDDKRRIDWVIVGGESGPNARPCNVQWIREIVEDCGIAGVPVFVKQLGAAPVWEPEEFHEEVEGGLLNLKDKKGGDPDEWPRGLNVRQFPAPYPATE